MGVSLTHLVVTLSDEQYKYALVYSIDQIYLQFETSKHKRDPSFNFHYPVQREVATMLMVTLQGCLLELKHQITLMGTVGCSLCGLAAHRWWRVVCDVFNFSQDDPN